MQTLGLRPPTPPPPSPVLPLSHRRMRRGVEGVGQEGCRVRVSHGQYLRLFCVVLRFVSALVLSFHLASGRACSRIRGQDMESEIGLSVLAVQGVGCESPEYLGTSDSLQTLIHTNLQKTQLWCPTTATSLGDSCCTVVGGYLYPRISGV